MIGELQKQVDALRERAARRSMSITPAPEGWQLASPWRVVVLGDLDAIGAWLSAAESYDHRPRQFFPTGCKADS
ncbi:MULTISPECIES: hypothetical protein [unclassified Nocardia]|uniref:hypothetical protein n=1 Tax=unclassified Nocardia TaxID=2637762 RepID=UPI00339E5852